MMPFLFYALPNFTILLAIMIDFITVRNLIDETEETLQLKLCCSANGLNKKIVTGELHRPGLALAGFTATFTYNRIQILGNTEISYLKSLSKEEMHRSIDKVLEFAIPVIIVTSDDSAPKYLFKVAGQRDIPVLNSPLQTTSFIHLLTDYLQRKFAETISKHGSLVDVYGIGILFTGRSGIGKSEIALDLVERGHRLVADDLVVLTKRTGDVIIGFGVENSEHMMEIRGVGIVDVKRMFGIRGVRKQKRVEVLAHLEDWDENKQYDRLGLDEKTENILGAEIPKVVLPINPGKNITVIAETIAMDQLLKMYGYHSAKEFNKSLRARMLNRGKSALAADLSRLEKDNE